MIWSMGGLFIKEDMKDPHIKITVCAPLGRSYETIHVKIYCIDTDRYCPCIFTHISF